MERVQLKKNVLDNVAVNDISQIRDILLKLQKEGKKVYRLDAGDPSFTVSDNIINAINEALITGKTHYTESAGIPELREQISLKLRKKNRIKNAIPDNVLVTSGGTNALYVIFRSLLSRIDKVIVPDPMWSDIAEIVKLAGGKPVSISIDQYKDLENYSALKNVRAIFVSSPHNPTGKVFKIEELKKIARFAAEKNSFIVSDEAYEDILFDNNKHVSPASIYPDTISIFSMSKSYAMTGLRIGYMYLNNAQLIERARKMLRYTINGVTSIIQYGALAALSGSQDTIDKMRKEYQNRRDILYDAVKSSRYLDPVLPDGTFYLWARIKRYPDNVKNSQEFSRYILEKNKIGSIPGSVFGKHGKDHVRFSFSADTEQIVEASKRIKRDL
ncbi:MAG: pyridoxal phosphate-dependent aminotransferase [Thermoplasmata archaeon]